MRIYFHGTSKENAEKILVGGFDIGTWFAFHLEDALEFGGDYVFRVEGFDEDSFSDDVDWQFHVLERVPPDRILRLDRYSRTAIDRVTFSALE